MQFQIPTKKKINPWLFSLFLTIPVIIIFSIYFLKAGQRTAPGFFQADNPLYVSYARQYLDAGKFSLLYSNPFNESNNYPAIYFQIQNFLYLVLFCLGISPGWIMLLSTCFFSFITFRLLIALLEHFMPFDNDTTLLTIFFAWGGGLLVVAGIPASMIKNPAHVNAIDNVFILDPAWGWWGLNIGRSLLFSAEAYYHALFFGGILAMVKSKWVLTTAIASMLVLSHPFTGIEFLCILNLWILAEKFIKKNTLVKSWFALSSLLLLFIHIWYYLIFLNRFPDHVSVQHQYSINWHLSYFNIIPAYVIVALFAFYSKLKLENRKSFFGSMDNTLLFAWFIVVALLENHEMFMKAMQPLHFTRGYLWSCLFLAGLPALSDFIKKLRREKNRFILLSLFSLLFLSDNIAWIINYSRAGSATGQSLYISKDEGNVLKWINTRADNNTLILGSDGSISYLSAVYTPAYPWFSQMFTTPFYDRKVKLYENFIRSGSIDSSWYGKNIIFIAKKDNNAEIARMQAIKTTKDSLTGIGVFRILVTRFYK